MVRQLLGVLDQRHFLAGIEFLHEIVEVFGLFLEDDGIQNNSGNLSVLPAKPPGVGQHQEGVLTPVFLGSVNLLENIRSCSTNNFCVKNFNQNQWDFYLASSRAVWRR